MEATVPDNPLSAALEEIRKRNEDRIRFYRLTEYTVEHDVAEGDVRRLLKALEAALKHHQPVQLHELAFDPRGNPRCTHDPDTDPDEHYEGDDGEWYCKSLPAGTACSGCPGSPDGEYADWPCPEYEAILAALTGKEAPVAEAD
jgi:hypothetical protein